MDPESVDDLETNETQSFRNNRKKRAAASVDLRAKNAVSPIRDQGKCGCEFFHNGFGLKINL